MAGTFQKAVDDARASVTKLPIALQPILQHLKDVGLLMDVNSKKIDAVNVKYKEQGDKIRGVLSSLTDELTRLNESEAPEEVMGIVESQTRARIAAEQEVQQAKLKQIEDQRKVEIDALGTASADFETLFNRVIGDSGEAAAEVARQWSRAPWEDWPRPPSMPGGGSYDPIPGYARGGVVSRPTPAWIAEGGHPEIVGSVDFMERALAGAMR
ncbi:MAG: hypothetical protein AAB835_00240, partial [Patescibacteria group bacterium]